MLPVHLAAAAAAPFTLCTLQRHSWLLCNTLLLCCHNCSCEPRTNEGDDISVIACYYNIILLSVYTVASESRPDQWQQQQHQWHTGTMLDISLFRPAKRFLRRYCQVLTYRMLLCCVFGHVSCKIFQDGWLRFYYNIYQVQYSNVSAPSFGSLRVALYCEPPLTTFFISSHGQWSIDSRHGKNEYASPPLPL